MLSILRRLLSLQTSVEDQARCSDMWAYIDSIVEKVVSVEKSQDFKECKLEPCGRNSCVLNDLILSSFVSISLLIDLSLYISKYSLRRMTFEI